VTWMLGLSFQQMTTCNSLSVELFGTQQGKAVGSAAHMVALRREAIGTHSVSTAWQLPDLVAAIREQRTALGLSEKEPISSLAAQT
jgi:tRNA U55 pseudouridine synthase TruB